MNSNVSIIILNWNGWKDTIECLESLYQITYPNSEAFFVNTLPQRDAKGRYDVIVVDNGSMDESIEKIKEYCEGEIGVESKFFEYSGGNKPIKIIEYRRKEAEAGGGKEKEIIDLPSNKKLIIIKNEKNYGFAEGNNIGIRYALKALNPGYVLLLNNDTVVDKEFLGELVKVGESDEKIGIIGPKIYYYDKPNKINFAGGRINFWKGRGEHICGNEIDKGQYDKIKKVDYIEGSCFLIRKRVIEKVGMMNINYFAYWEEADWCARVQKVGYKIIYAPKSMIWHKVSSTSKKISGFFEYHNTRNRFLFMKKYATRIQFISFILWFFVFNFWLMSGLLLIYHKNTKALICFYKGVKDGIAQLAP